jgi:hypothetical protein
MTSIGNRISASHSVMGTPLGLDDDPVNNLDRTTADKYHCFMTQYLATCHTGSIRDSSDAINIRAVLPRNCASPSPKSSGLLDLSTISCIRRQRAISTVTLPFRLSHGIPHYHYFTNLHFSRPAAYQVPNTACPAAASKYPVLMTRSSSARHLSLRLQNNVMEPTNVTTEKPGRRAFDNPALP